MRIGIVTIPPRSNYGGALQAYALQRVLKDMGHQADLIMPELELFRIKPYLAPFVYLKRAICKYILRDKSTKIFLNKVCLDQFNTANQHVIQFVNDNIEQYHCKDYTYIPSKAFEALVVGSDQVWVRDLINVYLEFAQTWNIKRYTYAVSFGHATLKRYTPDQIEQCKSLVGLFDAISVREDSGVTICREQFDVEATHLLDPTILLSKEDYMELADKEPRQENILFSYVLDKNDDKTTIIETCCNKLKLKVLSIIPKGEHVLYQDVDNIQDYIKASPYKWLAGIRDAEFIVTDSFHGVVFSIIFNKPFVAIMNKERGATRFTSLLKTFGLEDRIVSNSDELTDRHFTPIDYSAINKIKQEWQQRSFEFLKQL